MIFVTGGAGFIGSNFILDWLAAGGGPVLNLDRLTYAGNLENLASVERDPRYRFERLDICDGAAVLARMRELKPRAIVHFAAESHVARSIADDRIFFQTDVMGTQAVANAVVNHQDRVERFVHISTSEVYGSAVREPMDEDHPLLPSSPYAAAKAGADRLVDSYVRTYDIPAVTVRPFNNYGPRQHLEKCVPRFVTSAILGEPLELHGGGGASRDWLYVEDCVDGILACLEAPVDRVRGQVVNLGTGVATSVADIADTVLSIAGRETPRVSVGERPGQVHRHIGDARRAHALLGWAPRTGLREGLERTYRWYEQNRAWWEPLRWMRRVRVRLPDGREELH